jgi:U3 small nucleolar RNA-associated protein 20
MEKPRLQHQSYNASIKEVHLPSALTQAKDDHELSVRLSNTPASLRINIPIKGDSHFREALNNWRQLNLAPAFIKFANQAGPLSESMVLLLHHWREIIELWTGALDAADDEALRALLEYIPASSRRPV